MAETEELAERDPGEPGENTDNTEKGGGGASIVVISLWSENSAKLAVFYVHGYVAA